MTRLPVPQAPLDTRFEVASRARAWDNGPAGLAASIATIAFDAGSLLVPGEPASSRSEGRD